MTQVLDELIELLDVKPVETNAFVGQSQDLGFRNVFGGQVLGQATMAASKTVDNRFVHSLHGYFLRPGLVSEPISYEVDLIRTGKSFSTRRVLAKQGGRAIFNLSISFHGEELGFEHQSEKPAVPGPEGLPSELDLARQVKDKIPEAVREKFTCDRPIEVRVIDPVDPFKPHKRPAKKYSWIRAIHKVPDDPMIHLALLAYASDFGLATASLLPHGITWLSPKMQVASLDHGMWFHRPFRIDDWLLYEKESPSAAGGRGFNRGSIFSQDGSLVASVAQESLIRHHP
ncbi:acyl-CoA thioesterase [Pseudobacteriovorax antillogorgiicola]|uniref:Acyl-CoA thioesterase 2 n=1 Tax=Pseudobacteriovorax antillogorgiicola TaxID=1513793 RepID=A0A1Y6CE77_9BACT|nr:acyl-CoA thioesterase II [Pseudobacteriovorax antillogorgiicola]TCS47964.1 acyl-CoA thioesterase-2 [Pseudobacteriovorax antillogorgiicola]SMF58198.1 acyl-CoA thioesterase-2 [Pseudobacteriovorax antillogorgiicola]